jgi:hypothetical protein
MSQRRALPPTYVMGHALGGAGRQTGRLVLPGAGCAILQTNPLFYFLLDASKRK